MNIGGCACGGVNCPHCNPNLWAHPITIGNATLQHLTDRIAELEAENARLREAAQAVVDSATPHYDRWVNGVTRVCINRLAALLGGGEK